MKNYVVAVISFFDNDVQQFKVEAENETPRTHYQHLAKVLEAKNKIGTIIY